MKCGFYPYSKLRRKFNAVLIWKDSLGQIKRGQNERPNGFGE